MSRNAPPADVEPAVMVYLADLADVLDTWTPADLKELLQTGKTVLRVKRIGGGAGETTDDPRVSVQAFTARTGTTPRSSQKLLGQVTSKVLNIRTDAGPVEVPAELGGGIVRFDSGHLESGPVELPWPDPDVLLAECIYRISTRR